MSDDRPAGSTWLQGYRAFWIYTLARFALFGVLWLILWVVGVPWLFAALIAIVVSVPLSWFLLAKPRQAFAATIEARVGQRHERQVDLGKRLDDDGDAGDTGSALPPGVREMPAKGRTKRR
ncbi:DUF4229 domain-containing protein [Jatrophihabitans sp. YIM 134969]